MPAELPALLTPPAPTTDTSAAVTRPGGTLFERALAAQLTIAPGALERSHVLTTADFVRERQSFWAQHGFPPWEGTRAFVRPAVIYPPFPSYRMMLDAVQWTRWDRKQNRYGETNVLDARNRANVDTQRRVDRLMAELTRLFDGGRFSGGQNRDWLARGLEAAGRLGMIGAAGGPYAAVGLALAGFVMSACQDLWPAKKQQLLDLWREILRDCLPLERYLLIAYMREIFRACSRLEPGWNRADQRESEPFRWGVQPPVVGWDIVRAGPLGICTFLGEILFEYDCWPEPAKVPVPPVVIAQYRAKLDAARASGDRARIVAADSDLSFAMNPTTRMQDPLYVAYASAVIGADHPTGFYLRDEIHRRERYAPGTRSNVSPWMKELWPTIKDKTVEELTRNALELGIRGMSPTFYTRAIDMALVDQELPANGG